MQRFSQLGPDEFIKGLLTALRAGDTAVLEMDLQDSRFEQAVLAAFDHVKAYALNTHRKLLEADLRMRSEGGGSALETAINKLLLPGGYLRTLTGGQAGYEIKMSKGQAAKLLKKLPGGEDLWDQAAGIFLRTYNRSIAA